MVAAISQTTYSDALPWKKNCIFVKVSTNQRDHKRPIQYQDAVLPVWPIINMRGPWRHLIFMMGIPTLSGRTKFIYQIDPRHQCDICELSMVILIMCILNSVFKSKRSRISTIKITIAWAHKAQSIVLYEIVKCLGTNKISLWKRLRKYVFWS